MSQDPRPGRGQVVVGVVREHVETVVATAARFAEHFHAELVCASVDADRYRIDEFPDRSVVAMPIDPDLGDEEVEVFDPELRAAIAGVLDPLGVAWSARALAGGPAHELARLADEVDAAMIVVGTRDRGLTGSLREFFNGSVATQLAHRQHRPVVVVPLDPVGLDGSLPWDEEER